MSLKANIWKNFIFLLTNWSYYYSILWVYFLSLPNTEIKQIGLFMSLGFLVSFLLEIPTWYISDKFGHKNTLVLAKIFKLLSLCCYLLWSNIRRFGAGSILWALGWAFTSGTNQAFMHETLLALKKDQDYTKIMSRTNGLVALMSAIILTLLPLSMWIDMKLPFKLTKKVTYSWKEVLRIYHSISLKISKKVSKYFLRLRRQKTDHNSAIICWLTTAVASRPWKSWTAFWCWLSASTSKATHTQVSIIILFCIRNSIS